MEDLSVYNREGSPIRQAQLRLVKILIEIDRICKAHNILYWLDGGSALGAARHNGFIPWDDDIDIAVMRNDYKKLLSILEKELPDSYVLQNRRNEPYFHMVYSRIVDKNSEIVNFGKYYKFREKWKYKGIFVDIFYIERGNLSVKKFIDLFYFRSFFHKALSRKEKKFIGTIMWPISSICVYLLRSISFVFPNDNYIFGYGIPFPREFRKSEILPTKPIRFENVEFQGPAKVHEYLKRYFGDYLSLPPQEERFNHSDIIKLY